MPKVTTIASPTKGTSLVSLLSLSVTTEIRAFAEPFNKGTATAPNIASKQLTDKDVPGATLR